MLVVDLFAGCGGFSCGAGEAGCQVVLAVDWDSVALAYHKHNHQSCKHVCMTLGADSEDRLLLEIQRCVPAGRRWHLHGSPPCQALSAMRNILHGRDRSVGMGLVRWFVDFVEGATHHVEL